MLGLKHHASLTSLLKGRHKGLVPLRTPPEKRKPRKMRLRGPRQMPKLQTGINARTVRILHVEDSKLVAALVKDSLALEGWNVVTVSQARAALSQLAGGARFDVMLFDNELPDLKGLELVRAARRYEQCQHTPIIMLSASDVQSEAARAGVDAFLRKPEEINSLVETIELLLTQAADV
jgi:two-component system chemotaxis response regulator CheY